MKKKILYSIFIIIICLAAGYFFALVLERKTYPEEKKVTTIYPPQNIEPDSVENPNKSSKETAKEKIITIDQKIKQTVPFIVQAPFGNWKDLNFQNACEEASIVMAMGWIKGEKAISPQEAQKRILAIIDFENKNFGYSIDTDVLDMEKIFRQYFQHENVEAKENITLEDIKAEIQKGKIVIVPAFGQALYNPNFTQPGPVVHMLVIIGYDPLVKQFITNDPGTKNGAGYEYDEDVLFDAIWGYPSGPANPPSPTGKMKKTFISVSK